MKLYIGTSGYSYKEWKGTFYPEKLPAKDMLRYYAEQLNAVEINNTFYRLPKASVLETWAEQVPDNFRFVLKASRRITHFKRLKDAQDETEYLLETAGTLQRKLGVILIQLPPDMKKDVERLETFLTLLPNNAPAVFEFRHDSWSDGEVYDCLRKKGCAVCTADTDDNESEIVNTTSWGYVRLRRDDYTDDDLADWKNKLEEQGWKHAYLFLKHEEGDMAQLAANFLASQDA